MLGIQSPLIVKAISAALPAILAAMTGRASKGEGAAGLLSSLSDAPDLAMDGIEASFDTGSAEDLVNSGRGLLSGLLGGAENTSTIARAVGSNAGLPEEQASALMGMMGPGIAGMLKSQVAEGGLDANGLAGLLGDQKDFIAGAMPAGLADSLGGSGLLDSVKDQLASLSVGAVGAGTAAAAAAGSALGSAGDAASDAAGAAAGAARSAVDSAGGAARSAASSVAGAADSAADAAGDAAQSARNAVESAASGGMGWLKWALIAVAILILLWIIF